MGDSPFYVWKNTLVWGKEKNARNNKKKKKRGKRERKPRRGA